MSDRFTEPQDHLEIHLRNAGKLFNYPATPDFAGAEARRLQGGRESTRPRLRLGWALGLLLALVAGLLLTPPVRAQLIEFWQIGVVRIFSQPAASPSPDTVTRTPEPTPTLLPSLLNLAGRTTLEAARQQVDFPIRLPTYPTDPGEPDAVFVQDFEGPLIVLVWYTDETSSDTRPEVSFSLHIFGPGTMAAQKFAPESVQETQVNGERALWTEGPYMLELRYGEYGIRRLVEGHVLIWEDGVTYRLETTLPLEEAIRVAESLR